MEHCIDIYLISNIQHGFISGKFIITNLLELSNDLTKKNDDGNNIDIICIDFAKNFDTVPHNQLICELSKYDSKEKLLQWISDNLLNA